MQKYGAQTVSWINLASYLGRGQRQCYYIVVPIQMILKYSAFGEIILGLAKYILFTIHIAIILYRTLLL